MCNLDESTPAHFCIFLVNFEERFEDLDISEVLAKGVLIKILMGAEDFSVLLNGKKEESCLNMLKRGGHLTLYKR